MSIWIFLPIYYLFFSTELKEFFKYFRNKTLTSYMFSKYFLPLSCLFLFSIRSKFSILTKYDKSDFYNCVYGVSGIISKESFPNPKSQRNCFTFCRQTLLGKIASSSEGSELNNVVYIKHMTNCKCWDTFTFLWLEHLHYSSPLPWIQDRKKYNLLLRMPFLLNLDQKPSKVRNKLLDIL